MAASSVINPNLPILTLARHYVGVCEVQGKASNQLIAGWIKKAASWLTDGVSDVDGSIAWCGCFRGELGLATGTGVPKAHYRAANWLMWARPVDHTRPKLWMPGDTVILKRPGGYHVTLWERMHSSKPGVIECLGGNQGNKVCVAPFALADVVGVRRAS